MKQVSLKKGAAKLIAGILIFAMTAWIPQTAMQAKAAAEAAGSYGLEEDVQDGVILHAWNWSYNTIKSKLAEIAAAGYTTVQTSPVQQPKDYNEAYTDVKGQWWKLYQPVSFSIAQNSWLGSKEELTALCQEADQYGIKIICDIVVNHLANNGDGTQFSPQVAQYESTIYNDYNTYVHPFTSSSDNSVQEVVWGNIGMPDLNTSNSYIQSRAISLLRECIDCGVDGFRFDTAKHVETPSDGQYASDFWPNVINNAKQYASSTKGIDLYCYGEILNTPGSGRSFSSYTSYINVTDNKTSDAVTAQLAKGNAAGAGSSYYYTGLTSDKLVLWAESHDTYMGNSGSGGYSNTSGIDVSTINKAWAITASRAGATALYFARPGSAAMGSMGTTNWKDASVVAVNQFHNHFTGAQEYLSSSGSIAMNERYEIKGGTNGGAVLVNANGSSASVSDMPVYRLGDGTYKDQITGNTFTVSGGKISGSIGNTGIAVVYNTSGEIITPPVSTQQDIYFSNNQNWDTVYAYYWGGSQNVPAWPGTAMTYVEQNPYGERIYKISLPDDIKGLVFNNGSGTQTVDITAGITDKTGYYISGDSNGKCTVKAYIYQ